jgi:hypothetical protein
MAHPVMARDGAKPEIAISSRKGLVRRIVRQIGKQGLKRLKELGL